MDESSTGSRSDRLAIESLSDLLSGKTGPESAPLTELILRQAPHPILVFDLQGEIVFANAASLHLAGLAQQDGSGELKDRLLNRLLDETGQSITKGDSPWARALNGESAGGEYTLFRPGEGFRCVLVSAAPILIRRAVGGAVISIAEITEQKRSADLSLDRALERQRSLIAADIHDTLSQDLTAITLQLQAAEEDLSGDLTAARHHLLGAYRAARRSLTEVRRSIWMLAHDASRVEDLAGALSSLAQHLFSATPVTPEISLCDPPGWLPPNALRELLRISREALINVLKHAQATKVRVELVRSRDRLELSITDNGRGFPPGIVPDGSGGVGLTSMRKRTAQLGGSISIESRPGLGTRVLVVVLAHEQLSPGPQA
ncbi:MAG TPA: ATP-binding protein [Acidobacteriaceae bacterium]|nr:ATP-binding protein [Acidobacteriaceae bacterium]